MEARRPRVAARRVLRELATIPGVYVPSMYDVDYDGAAHRRGHARGIADVPARVDKRTVADLADWPYPKHQLVPLIEVVHDRLNVEVFRGCTRGCRFCQAGMITRPVRERPAEQVRTMVAGRPAPHRLRRGRAHVAVDRRLLRASTASSPTSSTTRRAAGSVSVSLPSLRVDAFTVGIASEIQKVRRTGLTFAPEARHVAAAPGDQQADHRGRPLRRGRRRVLAGLAAGEALLPHRPAHRDRRGHARHRRAGAQRASRSAASTRSRRQCTVSVGGFVPKPHTPFQWFGQNTRRRAAAQDRPAARRRSQAHAACSSSGTTPRRRSPRASRSRGDRRIGRGHRAGVARRRHVPGVERALRPRPLARRDGRRGPRSRLVRHPAPHRGRDPAVGPHRGRAAQATSSGRTGRRRCAEHGLPDCRWTPCYDCGVCTGYALEHVVASPVAAGGRQPGHRPGPRAAAARSRSTPRREARSSGGVR